MKLLTTTILAVAMPATADTKAGTNSAPHKIKIALIGDSTVTDNADWGLGFKQFHLGLLQIGYWTGAFVFLTAIGLGGFVSHVTGEILQKTGSYVPVFGYFSEMYLVSLFAIYLLAPKTKTEATK